MPSNPMFVAVFLLAFGLGASPASAELAVKISEELERGHALLQASKHEEAARAFRSADQLARGQSSEALLALASIHLGGSQYAEAEDVARKAVELGGDPTSVAAAHFLRGLALRAEGSPPEQDLAAAEEAFRHSAAADPEAFQPRFARARILVLLERELEAIESYRELSTRDLPKMRAEVVRLELCDAKRQALRRLPDLELPLWNGEDVGRAPMQIGPVEVSGKGAEHVAPKEVLKPIVLAAPRIRYPSASGEGTVFIGTVVDTDGCSRNVSLLWGIDPELDAAALEGVARRVYEPGTLDGKPVAVVYNTTVNFRRPEKK
ncbi:MAG: energy transducer TonB [Acidobacteriota bacterium]